MTQTLILDASGINRLTNKRITSTPAFAAIKTAYNVRLTGTSVSEVIAESDPVHRTRLLDTCQALMRDGDVVVPFNELLARHIAEFERACGFDWQNVPFEWPEGRREIAFREFITEELSAEERQHAIETEEHFERIYTDARPHFLEIFERYPDRPRPSVEEVLQAFQQPGYSYWTLGADLYRYVCGYTPDESAVRRLVDACPPFRSVLTAAFLAQHDRVITEKSDAELRKLAGRVDIFSATFLPYCDIFVSDDRDQQRFLRKVVDLTTGSTEVVWFRSFMDRIGIGNCTLRLTHPSHGRGASR